ELLVVAGTALLHCVDLRLDLLQGATVVGERSCASIVDVALARVGGKQRAVAARLLARGGFFLLRLGGGGRFRFALLLLALRIDAPYDETLRVELLHAVTHALHRNGGAVVFLAVRGGAAVGGLRQRAERRDHERREYCRF